MQLLGVRQQFTKCRTVNLAGANGELVRLRCQFTECTKLPRAHRSWTRARSRVFPATQDPCRAHGRDDLHSAHRSSSRQRHRAPPRRWWTFTSVPSPPASAKVRMRFTRRRVREAPRTLGEAFRQEPDHDQDERLLSGRWRFEVRSRLLPHPPHATDPGTAGRCLPALRDR